MMLVSNCVSFILANKKKMKQKKTKADKASRSREAQEAHFNGILRFLPKFHEFRRNLVIFERNLVIFAEIL